MSQDSNTVKDDARIATRRLETEVAVKALRRRFSAEYKLRILEEAETCSSGEIGALLRREGLYSSHLTTWRHQREAGQLAGLAAKKRGPKPNREAEELKRLRKENERLQVRLQQAEAIIEAQKKLAQLFDLGSRSESNEPK
jgi:transposase